MVYVGATTFRHNQQQGATTRHELPGFQAPESLKSLKSMQIQQNLVKSTESHVNPWQTIELHTQSAISSRP